MASESLIIAFTRSQF